MGLLDRFRSKGTATKAGGATSARFECLHETLTPQWDDAADEGDESKAIGFLCSACQNTLTPQQAGWARKRGTEGSRR
jgi:hypothetical protein